MEKSCVPALHIRSAVYTWSLSSLVTVHLLWLQFVSVGSMYGCGRDHQSEFLLIVSREVKVEETCLQKCSGEVCPSLHTALFFVLFFPPQIFLSAPLCYMYTCMALHKARWEYCQLGWAPTSVAEPTNFLAWIWRLLLSWSST